MPTSFGRALPKIETAQTRAEWASTGVDVHVILLVHGMGNCAAGWSNSLQTALKGYYDPAKYSFLAPFTFDNEFKFAEISYNKNFVDYLADARTQANALSKWSKLATGLSGDVMGVLQRVVDAASHVPADNFLVNSLGDVAFYLASDIGELVKNDVAAQIATALAPPFDPTTDRWSVIGHSLGTRVVTDVLQAGFTAAPNLRAFGKARNVIQIANVSRLIQKFAAPFAPTGDVYHGAVYPSLSAANGCCTHFINATHRLDPFAFIEEFDPPADFGDKAVFLSNLYH